MKKQKTKQLKDTLQETLKESVAIHGTKLHAEVFGVSPRCINKWCQSMTKVNKVTRLGVKYFLSDIKFNTLEAHET